MFIRNILFLLACTILAFRISAQEGRVDCDPNDRPVACYLLYLPVCGWTSAGTSATYDNDCTACAAPDVLYFTSGACKGEAVINEERSPEKPDMNNSEVDENGTEEQESIAVFEVETELDEPEISTLESEETQPAEGGETEKIEESELVDWAQSPALTNLDDAHGWNDIKYYSTIRVLTFYQSLWLFARGDDGLQVYNYNYSAKSWNTLPTLPDLADSNNWGAGPEYYSTIRVIVLPNGFLLLARNADGLQVYQYNLILNAWIPKQALASLSDDNGWRDQEYYSTIQAFSVSGTVWVFARSATGEQVHQYDPETDVWNWNTLPSLAALSDANKWGTEHKYYSTIQVVRLDRDFWLLGRGSDGIQLFKYGVASVRWTPMATLPELSDENRWGDSQYYSTIQAVVLEANIWLFARNEFGIQTYQYNVEKNIWAPKQSLPALSDENNWDKVEYYSTIQVVSLNTTIALSARGPNGLQYYEYLPITDTWKSRSTITTLSDENKWYRKEYYSTIEGFYYGGSVNVIARGPSGLRVYEYAG